MFSMVALDDEEEDGETALLIRERANLIRLSSKLFKSAFEQVRSANSGMQQRIEIIKAKSQFNIALKGLNRFRFERLPLFDKGR